MSGQGTTPQSNFGGLVPPPHLATASRPKLDLGPMTGDGTYITERSVSLVETFSDLLGKDFRLEDYPFGCTDCKTFIRAPLQDEEGYLVVEHELSHNLFGTDLTLTEAFRDKAVERLLRRAKIPATHKDAKPYKEKLDLILHHLWNILEDHRCRWLWAQLYPGGGELLEKRWHDIAQFEMGEHAEKDLLTFLGRKAAGVDTIGAPPEFQRCAPHMKKAKNLVEGVDAASCLAITARLVDDIAEELLDSYPQDKVEEAKDKLNAMAKALAGPGTAGKGHGDVEDNPMGGKDLQPPPGKKKRPTAKQMKRIQQVLTAKIDDEREDADGMSSFSSLLQSGAEEMEERLEEARRVMAQPKKSVEEESEDLLINSCKVAKVRGTFVTPTVSLPRPSPTAAQLRFYLEKIRMKKKRRLAEDGDDIDIPAYLEAKLGGDLDGANIFKHTWKEGGMELLILTDLSGSMYGMGMQLVDQAVADVSAACENLRVEVTLWGFSCTLFFFKKLGSVQNAKGVQHGGTNMVQALDVAYEWAKSSKSTRAVILMTDGMPTSLRGRRSTGNAIKDLGNLLDEMRTDKVILSVLAIGHPGLKDMYDRGFGEGRYGMLPNVQALATALPQTAKVLVEAHLKKGGS